MTQNRRKHRQISSFLFIQLNSLQEKETNRAKTSKTLIKIFIEDVGEEKEITPNKNTDGREAIEVLAKCQSYK